MSQFENSEIMVAYAALMAPALAAGDAIDFAQELAYEIPVGLAADLAIGAAITYGTAAMLPGVGLAGAGAWVAGSSILAMMGGPVGIAIGLAIAGAVALYTVSKIADDEVTGLIERLEALDADTPETQAFIDDWIANLKGYLPYLALQPTTPDLQKRIQNGNTTSQGLTGLYNYLVAMKEDWPKLKARLTDWGWDDSQAYEAINQTLAKMRQGLDQAKAAVRADVQKFIAAAGQQKKKSYPKMAQKIQDMWQQLTKIHGAAPTFDSEGERAGYELAVNITKGSVTLEDFEKNFNNMAALQILLEQGLKASSQPTAQPQAIAMGIDPEFTKLALTLGNGEMVTLQGVSGKTQPKQPGVDGKKPQKKSRSPMIKGLQNAINRINYAYNAGAGTIEEDGVYGPVTAGALHDILRSPHPDPRYDDVRWTIGKSVAHNAKVNADIVKDVATMRGRPQLIADVYRVLAPIAASLKGPVADHGIAGKTQRRPISTRETIEMEQGPAESDSGPGRRYAVPKDPNQLTWALASSFLMKDEKTGETTSAYIWFRDMGIATKNDVSMMVQLVEAFIEEEQQGQRVWDPATTPQALQGFVRQRMGGREGEHRLF